MPLGDQLSVVVCAVEPPGVAFGQVSGPIAGGACPAGSDQYVVTRYVPYTASQSYFDRLQTEFSPAEATAFFGFGFGLVIFFFAIGASLSPLIRPFWRPGGDVL